MSTELPDYEQIARDFAVSAEFIPAMIGATHAAWDGSGFSVELFPDGHYRVLWNGQIGNRYQSPGLLVSVPAFEDEYVAGDPDWETTCCDWHNLDDYRDQLVNRVREILLP